MLLTCLDGLFPLDMIDWDFISIYTVSRYLALLSDVVITEQPQPLIVLQCTMASTFQ